ncbi:hypothetical protein GGR53DRAFT_480172 [Hypoxylon sp. FL1150]|nr:hypothetical protein GGR53DRAFT_480172 [Hypoxylon sp. FL1150]
MARHASPVPSSRSGGVMDDHNARISSDYEQDIAQPLTDTPEDSSSAVPNEVNSEADAHEKDSTAIQITHHPDRTHRESKFKNIRTQLLVQLLVLCLLVIVIVFVQGTYSAQKRSENKSPLSGFLKTDVSTTIAVLRAAQGILSGLTSMAVSDTFVLIQWIMINRQNGLSYPHLLALSPTTSISGLLSLVHSSSSKTPAQIWAILRATTSVVVWIAGLLLFFNTTLVTVYDTAITYEATAGVGPFNGSLVQPFLQALRATAPGYPYTILPYTYFAAVYTLVLNPLISSVSEPVSCQDGKCFSYLLSGGLEMVAPWVPEGHIDYPMIKIDPVASLQMDFTQYASDEFEEVDCDIYGETGFTIGIRLCLVHEPTLPGSLRAGLFVCMNGTDGDNCQVSQPAPNMTTTMSVFTRQATVVTARSNYSIINVESLTPPVPLIEGIDLQSYRAALNWLLNSSAANVPPPSSVSQSFWSSPAQMMDNSTYGILSQNFQSILAFPFWLFNENNWGNVETKSNQTNPALPAYFRTQASIVSPYSKIRFDPTMFALFVALQGLATALTWAALLWAWRVSQSLPTSSSFPLFDFAFRARLEGDVEVSETPVNKNRDIIRLMKDITVHKKESDTIE